jgi:hypothetical protein
MIYKLDTKRRGRKMECEEKEEIYLLIYTIQGKLLMFTCWRAKDKKWSRERKKILFQVGQKNVLNSNVSGNQIRKRENTKGCFYT